MDDSVVTMTFPARPEYLRLARIATADAASRAGLDYEEIDDVRIAVSELCSLVASASGRTISLEFQSAPDALTVEGWTTSGSDPLSDDPLSRTIIAAVVDEHEVLETPDEVRFRVVKRRRRREV
jgi:serine/threonine-protein kinase RsbW